MIRRLFKKTVHVKPVTSNSAFFGWMVVGPKREYQHLLDDLRRYGWRTFFDNLLFTLRVKK